jgi:hypothetical protein
MPLTDIPILLINAALLAIIALPFVMAFSVMYAARKIVRPLWAIYQHEYGAQRKLPAPLKPAAPPLETAPAPQREVVLSAFGR